MFDGFLDLETEFELILKNVDDVDKILEDCAKDFVSDLLKLPKPRSSINKSGYTHLLDTFTYEKREYGLCVGWGKYFGSIVENGSKYMEPRPHFKKCFNSNKNKYFEKMKQKIFK